MAQRPVVVIGLDETKAFLRRMPERHYKAAREAVSESTFRLHRVLFRRLSGDPLKVRSGNARRSLQPRVTGTTLNTLRGEVFGRRSVAPYLAAHETGAKVRAKRAYRKLPGGPYLNIPTDHNMTGAGVVRLTARQVFDQGGAIVAITAPKARYMVVLNGRPMFWLVKEITIPARLGARAAAEQEVPTLLSRLSGLMEE